MSPSITSGSEKPSELYAGGLIEDDLVAVAVRAGSHVAPDGADDRVL
ncbi:MAG: hypothetical protein M3022_04045 [Actinomycetota bacterium]|nr:hypothetical protein [Actinomycetota bacterium]